MMKSVLFLIVMIFSLTVLATPHKSLPDNDLWKQDSLNKKSNVTQQMFNTVIDTAYAIYKPIVDKNKEKLTINKNWKSTTVNADCSRVGKSVTINMYGGLARRQEIIPGGFAFVLCHELSHAYGGTPYIDTTRKMSAEGQADYMGGKDCVKKIIEKLNLSYEGNSYMADLCQHNAICISGLESGQSLGNLLATISEEALPDYSTPDPTVVSKTELSYPKTVQCRLDTYGAGILNKDRPKCWFKK